MSPGGIEHVVIPGSEHRAIESARLVGRPAGGDAVEVTLLLRYPPGGGPRHADEMGALSPHERRHLTHEEFTAAHGASPNDIGLVEAFVRDHGLSIVEVDAAQRIVVVTGRVEQVNRAFKVELGHYEHDDGHFRGHSGAVHVPSQLDSVVVGVFGLSTTPMARRRRHLAHADAAVLPSPDDTLFYTPSHLAEMYNFPRDADGAGQCIALLEFEGGYQREDLDAYFEELGIPTPAIVDVGVAGARNAPIGQAMSYDAEVTLDIEVAGAAAPGAQLVVYFAPNSQAGWMRAVKQAVHDTTHHPSVISISWSKLETGWDDQTTEAINDAFRDAAALGITVCCSSGDFGSSDNQPEGAHVVFPASSPYVLACGGTQLSAAEGRIDDEVVWNELATRRGATGGGVSVVFDPPAWQADAGVPPSANDGRTRGRGLPDVAANADPNSGYLVRVDGVRFVSGGTSASTPLWAALIARINQRLGTRVGFINELLYTRLSGSGVCRGVTRGDNGAYRAGPGWNACTGWGSPDGTRLCDALGKGG